MTSDAKRKIPLEAIRAECKSQIESLCARLLPQGRRHGGWWKCHVPWRDDKDASLMVSFSSARWRDWGRPGDDGTMLDLVMRLDNCSLMDAKDTLADLLGMGGDVEYKPTVQVKKSCKDCRHLWRRFPKDVHNWFTGRTHKVTGDRYFCTLCVDFMFGDPKPLSLARHPRGECGTFGTLHEIPTA